LLVPLLKPPHLFAARDQRCEPMMITASPNSIAMPTAAAVGIPAADEIVPEFRDQCEGAESEKNLDTIAHPKWHPQTRPIGRLHRMRIRRAPGLRRETPRLLNESEVAPKLHRSTSLSAPFSSIAPKIIFSKVTLPSTDASTDDSRSF